jgi:hypothetical protein
VDFAGEVEDGAWIMHARWPWILATVFLLACLPVTFFAGVYVGTVVVRSQPRPVAPLPPSLTHIIKVPRASADLPAGRKIRTSDIVILAMPHSDLVATGTDLKRVMILPEQIAGRTLKEALKADDFFTVDKFYLEGEEPREPAQEDVPANGCSQLGRLEDRRIGPGTRFFDTRAQSTNGWPATALISDSSTVRAPDLLLHGNTLFFGRLLVVIVCYLSTYT